MKPLVTEQYKTDPYCELRLGIASWAGNNENVKSFKYTWFDKNGHVTRGGEIPVECLS